MNKEIKKTLNDKNARDKLDIENIIDNRKTLMNEFKYNLDTFDKSL